MKVGKKSSGDGQMRSSGPGGRFAIETGAIEIPQLPVTTVVTPWLTLQAIAGFETQKKPGHAEFLPVHVIGNAPSGIPIVKAQQQRSSATLFPLSGADGFVVLPAEAEATRARDRLPSRFFC